MTKEEQKTTASTILEQLGGGQFKAMTGAKNMVIVTEGRGGLSFRLPKFAGLKINHVKIKLNDMDLYDIDFGRVWGVNYKVLSTETGVYADQLQTIFTKATGLDTHL